MFNKFVSNKKPDGLAPKFKSKNFKIRRRSPFSRGIVNMNKLGFLLLTLYLVLLSEVLCSESENDVLTLQDELDNKGEEEMEPSDRRRPSNEQEKDILLLDALGRRKGYHHNSYSSSQEDDSIMDLLGKSKFKYKFKT